MTLTVDFEGGQWVVVEPFLGLFGEGDRLTEAVGDFWTSLQCLRSDLEGDEANLSDHLRRQLGYLRAVMP
jgi:hypothetical protein